MFVNKKYKAFIAALLIIFQIAQVPAGNSFCLAPQSGMNKNLQTLENQTLFLSLTELPSLQIQNRKDLNQLCRKFENNFGVAMPETKGADTNKIKENLKQVLKSYDKDLVQIICKLSSESAEEKIRIGAVFETAQELGFKTLLIIPSILLGGDQDQKIPKADKIYVEFEGMGMSAPLNSSQPLDQIHALTGGWGTEERCFSNITNTLISFNDKNPDYRNAVKTNKTILIPGKQNNSNDPPYISKGKITPAPVTKPGLIPPDKNIRPGNSKRQALIKKAIISALVLFTASMLWVGGIVMKYEFLDTTPIMKYKETFVAKDSLLSPSKELDSLCYSYIENELSSSHPEAKDSLQSAINIKTYEAEKIVAQSGYFSSVQGFSDLSLLKELVMQNDPKAFMTLLSLLDSNQDYPVEMRLEALKIAELYLSSINSRIDINKAYANRNIVADMIASSLENTFTAFYKDSTYHDFFMQSISFLSSSTSSRFTTPSKDFINTLVKALHEKDVFSEDLTNSLINYFNLLLTFHQTSLGDAAVRNYSNTFFPMENIQTLKDQDVLLAIKMASHKWSEELKNLTFQEGYTAFEFLNNPMIRDRIKTIAENQKGTFSLGQQETAIDYLVNSSGKEMLLERYGREIKDFSVLSSSQKILLSYLLLNTNDFNTILSESPETTVLLTRFSENIDPLKDKALISYLCTLYQKMYSLNQQFSSNTPYRNFLDALLSKVPRHYPSLSGENVLQNKDIVGWYTAYYNLYKALPANQGDFFKGFSKDPSFYDSTLFQKCKTSDDFIYLSTMAYSIYQPDPGSSIQKTDLQDIIFNGLKKNSGEDVGGKISLPVYEKIRNTLNSCKEASGNKMLIMLNADYINSGLNPEKMSPKDIEPALERALEFYAFQSGDQDTDDSYRMIANYILGRISTYINTHLDQFYNELGRSQIEAIKGTLLYHDLEIDETPGPVVKVWQNVKKGNWTYLMYKAQSLFRNIFKLSSSETTPSVPSNQGSSEDSTKMANPAIALEKSYTLSKSRQFTLDKGYELLEVKKTGQTELLAYVIKGNTAQGARIRLMLDVGNTRGGLTRQSMHITNQKDSSIVIDAPLGFSTNILTGSTLDFSAEKGVIKNPVCLPYRNDAMVFITPDDKMHIADKQNLWIHDLDPSVSKETDKKLNIAYDLNDYILFTKIIQEQKLSCVTTLLLSSPTRSIDGIKDGPKSRRLIGMDTQGNLILVDTETDMTTEEATRIMKEAAGGDILIAYMDTGGVDYAELEVNNHTKLLQTGNSHENKSVNRVYLLKTPHQGKLKDIGKTSDETGIDNSILDFVRENIWRPAAESIQPAALQLKNAVTSSAKILVDDSYMPEGMSAYHFYEGSTLIVVVKENYYEEALYHELRESHWMKQGLTPTEAHRLAAAEQALEYPESLYYSDQINQSTFDELLSLSKENEEQRKAQHALVQKYLGEDNILRVIEFERSFRKCVQAALLNGKGRNEKSVSRAA